MVDVFSEVEYHVVLSHEDQTDITTALEELLFYQAGSEHEGSLKEEFYAVNEQGGEYWRHPLAELYYALIIAAERHEKEAE